MVGKNSSRATSLLRQAWVLSFAACSFLALRFLFFHVATENANLIIAVLLKVKSVFLAKTKLEQVVIETLFGYAHFGCCVLKTVADEISVSVNAIVEFAPERNLLNDVGDGSLLGSLRILSLWHMKEISGFYLLLRSRETNVKCTYQEVHLIKAQRFTLAHRRK